MLLLKASAKLYTIKVILKLAMITQNAADLNPVENGLLTSKPLSLCFSIDIKRAQGPQKTPSNLGL